MKTESLYLTDAYLQEFDATVIAVDGNSVALDRTAFYPGGGGQPNDTGTMDVGGEIRDVTKVRKEDGVIWHELDGPVPAVGIEVHGTIDWNRRHALMRTHTALHILCGIAWHHYQVKVTGGNMDELSARMDFEFEEINPELLSDFEAKANAEVAAARATSVAFLPRDAADKDPDLIRTKINLLPKDITEVRVVTIEGLDTQADGGTHVASTAEVGAITFTGYKNKGKSNKRIELAIS